MDVILDGTPLLGPRTGIGQYVAHLYQALRTRPDVVPRLYAFTIRHGSRPVDVQPGDWVRRTAPARILQRTWAATAWPPAELLLPSGDVLHATNFTGPPARRTPRVVTVHDLAFSRLPGTVHQRTRRLSGLIEDQAATAAAVLTPTHAVRDEVVEHLALDPGRVHVTPLGVDPSWSRARPPTQAWRAENGVPADYLLAVGTQEPRKNLTALVQAHAAAGRSRVLPLVVVGPAGWGDVVRPSQDVVVLPYQPAETLRSLVAGAAALVFPSLYEGFGLPVLEALAAGTRVLANDIPPLREVLGPCADLVDATDIEALSAALVAVSAAGKDEEARQRGRERAATFTWGACAEATVQAYRRALVG
ncbi:glycosyltransferase family 4 protein [Modestobacter sp. VKM Ac-2984]|uniref:glycosyltransferase family 4 protein n=1 Tax=Modestobacter sp. VKM Ac-2984 TaxID=3004138 RepID=UPI0022AB3713|nr:glycosyltransferase family 1 protein [Modestobacter sp. VKM Ac-2984]MCZ2816406.1 glycosyltransferase family 1 protein [Modestobacter sp. VKM Ac-2984]